MLRVLAFNFEVGLLLVYYHHMLVFIAKLAKLLAANRALEGLVPGVLPEMVPQVTTLGELHFAVVEKALKSFYPAFFRFLDFIDPIFRGWHAVEINRSL